MERDGSDGRYRVSGDLTFRGVTRTLRGRDDDRRRSTTARSGSRASRTFDIRDFGMEPPRILMLQVEPDVDVRVEIVADEGGLTCTSSDLCSSIVDAIERRAGERPVARVRVQVGRLHHVHPEAFDQSFAVAAMGTVAEDAAAELVLLPVTARCGSCGGDVGRRRDPARLPHVRRASRSSWSGGDELMLESIEYRG